MKYPTILIMSLMLAGACDRSATQTPALADPIAPVVEAVEDAQPEQNFSYSPFLVQVHGSPYFRSISFKDVGLIRDSKSPDDPVLEVIAESLSHHMMAEGNGMMTEVAYDPGQLNPENHTSCGQSHIYVDVWQKHDHSWGYSLWSGCGEESNFEWREVPAGPETDVTEMVSPLTVAIAQSLKTATEKACFRKHC